MHDLNVGNSTLHREFKSGVRMLIINIILKQFTSKYQYGHIFIAVCIFLTISFFLYFCDIYAYF